jgi:hypothetical protein
VLLVSTFFQDRRRISNHEEHEEKEKILFVMRRPGESRSCRVFFFKKMYMQIETPELDSFEDCVPEFNGLKVVD